MSQDSKPVYRPALMAGTLWFIAMCNAFAFRLWLMADILYWMFVPVIVLIILYLWGKAFSTNSWEKIPLLSVDPGMHTATPAWLDAKIEYHYQYKGENYTGRRIQYPFFYYKEALKVDLYKAILKNKITHAYVNPNSPSQSALLQGFGRGDIAFMALIALFFGFWGFVYHASWTERFL